MTSPSPVSSLHALKADAISHRERLAQFDPKSIIAGQGVDEAALERIMEWVKNELALNLVPMFESVVDAVHEDIVPPIAELRQDVDDILEDSGDQLTPESAEVIVGVFEQGRVLANLLEKAVQHADQITKKKAKDAIRAYRASELAARELVEAVVIDDGDGEDAVVDDPAETGTDVAVDDVEDAPEVDGEPADASSQEA